MQTKNKELAKKIISFLVQHNKLRNEAELAHLLGVPQSTISSWKKRGRVNADKLCAAFPALRRDWLLHGEGPVFREKERDYRGLERVVVEWLEQEVFVDPAETMALIDLLRKEYAGFRKRLQK